MQEDTHVKLIKPKNSEVGKWKKNETKYKKILMLNLSSPRIQKLASGERVKLSASESSQLLICCYPNVQVKRSVLALIGHHIRSVQDRFRSKSFDAMQGHMGHGHRHHGCHNPPMHHIT